MGFRKDVARNRVLLVEAVLLLFFSGGMWVTISIFQSTSDASQDAGGMAAVGALFGLVLLGVVLLGFVGTVCLTYIYRRGRGIRGEHPGRLLVFVVSVLSFPLLGVWAIPLWIFGTTAYVFCLVVYRWWHPVSPSPSR